MEIENLYNELLRNIRAFTNSIKRSNNLEVMNAISILSDNLEKIKFLTKNNIALEKRLIREFRKFSKNIFIKTNNESIYLSKLQKNIDFLTWINKNISINQSARKFTVAQREIFYADLGINIGSEQNGRRPVIILQNNTGNSKGNTTIIAPVTTHQKRIEWDKDKKRYFIRITENGENKFKYLDFYEIPLKLEQKEKGIYGFVNVMHVRAIDRKRIDSVCLGKATQKCFENIINSLNKNLG